MSSSTLIFYAFFISCLFQNHFFILAVKELRFPHVYGILAAFGDFNSDKLTDIFVIKSKGKSFQIIRQYEPGDKPVLRPEQSWSCSLKNDEYIVGLIPSDFTGDAFLDIVVITQKPKDKLSYFYLRLVNGSTDARGNLQCDILNRQPFARVLNQPLVLDINGDMISDLLAEDENNEYRLWLGSSDGFTKNPTFPLNKPVQKFQNMRTPNSNAFIDLNKDMVADIFIDGKDNFTYWFAQKEGYSSPSVTFNHPAYEHLGSSSFLDINRDGIIDHLILACNKTCSILALRSYSDPKWEILMDKIEINGNNYLFSDIIYQYSTFPMKARIGDVNGDGFPDLIALMHSSTSSAVSSVSVLFLNVASRSNSFGRTFEAQLLNNQSFQASEPKLIAFFDLYEDGKVDTIYSGLAVANGSANIPRKDELQIAVLLNSKANEANFLKVLVTSGLCLGGSCYKENILQKEYKVPYGTNKAGPMVCYQLVDDRGNSVHSCCGQLPQSSDFSLQMPYCLYGLGPDANYIDHVKIAFPAGNTSEIFIRDEPFIVPDSQIVVIPHPLDHPSKWIIQLFVRPSDIIYKTLYTFLGICGGLVIIILFLHHKEQLKDLAEQEQYRITWPDRRR
ncbi:T-cell immunomodulatory protein-like protein [Dinothrombium tinctorium]|uniref:T-cell immunomodulatory protein-like protein n=1 Tax=Dinothrombium tinctorium TaxID=1965070 RepID=A0A3S3SLQ6_9ACAR|nr:T-cell immunomodulatory protein-like protein [Dinothrombium tinctorium]